MKPGTQSWKQVTAGVLTLLNEVDPYRLSPGRPEGAPEDEYAPESKAIAQHLLSQKAIKSEQVDTIWYEWFGESLSQVTGAGVTQNLVACLNQLVRYSGPSAEEAAGGQSQGCGRSNRLRADGAPGD